jgi:hypothetical protein
MAVRCMQALVRNIAAAALLQLALVACGSRAEQTAWRNPAPSAHAQPPTFAFVAPQAWHSRKPGVPIVEPPDLGEEVWRVLVNRTQPLQAKTPLWQRLIASQTVELEMPPDSKFRCLVPPLQVDSEINAFGTKLKAWLLTRPVRCSSDGWQSWTESTHRVRKLPDASRELAEDTGLLLREWDASGAVRETFVLLRSDKAKREATTGPPQILRDALADED